MKFNLSLRKTRPVLNHEGALAETLSKEMELYAAAVTSSLSGKFYESGEKRIGRLRELVSGCDPGFVAKLAVYAREQMNLRSVPLVLAVELARVASGNPLVSRCITRVIRRADEITELLAYYQLANNRTGAKKLNRLSAQVRKGIAASFRKFDEYQFAKYDRKAEIRLRDALFLSHPKPANEIEKALFEKLASGSLEVPYTWETELSILGQTKFEHKSGKQAAFRSKWEELVFSGNLGYMALLRNVRNLLEAGVSDECMAAAAKTLSDPDQVARSRQLPFRFFSAYREVSELRLRNADVVLAALEKAALAAAAGIEGFDAEDKVVIACDVSGSMQKPVSKNSKVQNFDIGLVLAMLMKSRLRKVTIGIFGDFWKEIRTADDGILASVLKMHKREGEVGYATNGHLIISDLIEKKKRVDHVLIFTDCQLYNSGNLLSQPVVRLWKKYKGIAPAAKLYLFDLAGYGTTPLKTEKNDVFLIAGWSEKVFGVLKALREGGNALTEIKKIEI